MFKRIDLAARPRAKCEAVVKLSEFAVAYKDRLAGIDINPFIARVRGDGAMGLDAVIEI